MPFDPGQMTLQERLLRTINEMGGMDKFNRILGKLYESHGDDFTNLVGGSRLTGEKNFRPNQIRSILKDSSFGSQGQRGFLQSIIDALPKRERGTSKAAKARGGGGGGGGGEGGGGSDIDWLLNRFLGDFTIPMPNPNDWQAYQPPSGFVQGFQPWDPINFTLDPSIQSGRPRDQTFNPGNFLPPVPLENPNVPPWPNFPVYENPYPSLQVPPQHRATGAGGGRGGEGGGGDGPGDRPLDRGPQRIDPFDRGPGIPIGPTIPPLERPLGDPLAMGMGTPQMPMPPGGGMPMPPMPQQGGMPPQGGMPQQGGMGGMPPQIMQLLQMFLGGGLQR
ncbi:MAG: hypothetical protein ACYSWU_11425 [Planctomycetota bacterium]|jgi:hypothetical protein